MSRFKLYILFGFILLSTLVRAQTTNHQVYALFIVNIAKYSSWPNAHAEMNITVFGKTKVFDELVKQNGKNVNGTVKVNQVDDIESLGSPNIIYLADGKSSSLDAILKAVEGKPVMVIAEREGLYKKGAGFSFIVLENGTLRFDLNNTDLEKRQIKVAKNLAVLANASI